MAKISDNERWFDTRWKQIGGPPFSDINYKFHDTRQWELDRVWVDVKVALEVDGGGHKMYWKKYHNDIAKGNAAAYYGWTLFRITARMIQHDDIGFLEMLKNFLEGKYAEKAGNGGSNDTIPANTDQP